MARRTKGDVAIQKNAFWIATLHFVPFAMTLFPRIYYFFTSNSRYLGKEGKPFQPERSYQRRLPPWFSNLLPEGALRSYLANMWGVPTQREALLLQKLGKDLPGAVEIYPVLDSITDQDFEIAGSSSPLHFSLAGIQMKFSARLLDPNRLTIPSDGTGGRWILKFPSPVYQAIPENETAIMNLAKLCGINVPEFNLYDLDKISGIPEKILSHNAKFFAIKRFDRTDTGTKIHMEDFCQIYNLYPEEKYDKASYTNIANTILEIAGEHDLIEFIRRLAFSILIGNGDMHLKNWSILYKDGTSPTIAPAYDLLSTVPYIPQDKLALTLSKEKKFTNRPAAKVLCMMGVIGSRYPLVWGRLLDCDKPLL